MVDSLSAPYTFMGLKVYIDNNAMVDVVEDWSNVRSKARGKRRYKRGFKQNIALRKIPKKQAVQIGDKVFMHHDLYLELLRKMNENGQYIKENYITDDLPFRYESESEVQKHDFWGNNLWKSREVFIDQPRIYHSWGV